MCFISFKKKILFEDWDKLLLLSLLLLLLLFLFLLLLLSLIVIWKIESPNSEYFKICLFSHHKEKVWLFSKCAANNVGQLIARFDLIINTWLPYTDLAKSIDVRFWCEYPEQQTRHRIQNCTTEREKCQATAISHVLCFLSFRETEEKQL